MVTEYLKIHLWESETAKLHHDLPTLKVMDCGPRNQTGVSQGYEPDGESTLCPQSTYIFLTFTPSICHRGSFKALYNRAGQFIVNPT